MGPLPARLATGPDVRNRTHPAYGEAAYRQAKRELRLHEHLCWHGCGRRATSPDHYPALADHDHDPGSECCALLPSCLACQSSSGAAVGNRRRRASMLQRLAPGSDRR